MSEEATTSPSLKGTTPECRHVWQLIDALGDGDPTPEALEEISEHFARCVKCGDAEASLEEMLAMYRAESTPPIPARVEQHLLDCMCGHN